MSAEAATAPVDPTAPADDGARPTQTLPTGQLVRLSLYWLGLSCVFIGLTKILGGRILFEGLGDETMKATTLFILGFMGTIIAVIVQPTVGSISDYTISRWGRRKPYIFIGSTLDIVFLLGIATSNTVLAIAAFMALLQFSANFAQGPFQGYIPDLVPEKQVGIASALVGLFQVLGNAAGFAIGAIAVATNNFWLGTMALGALEFVTMLAVVIRVRRGSHAQGARGPQLAVHRPRGLGHRHPEGALLRVARVVPLVRADGHEHAHQLRDLLLRPVVRHRAGGHRTCRCCPCWARRSWATSSRWCPPLAPRTGSGASP